MFFFFFFQAEDGIRDVAVTGVQTCALPISRDPPQHAHPQDEGVRPVSAPLPPVRVERALGLLPELEAVAPLRALLVSISRPDRKSTRLNSSHGYISYAVFCLKKKKKNHHTV